jgi:hypothetical protein
MLRLLVIGFFGKRWVRSWRFITGLPTVSLLLFIADRADAQYRDPESHTVRWVWNDSVSESATIEQTLAALDRTATRKKLQCRLGECFADFPLPVRFDENGLDDEAVSQEEMVDVVVGPGESFRSQLDSILTPRNLTRRPYPSYLLITNRRNATAINCVYDVSSLMTKTSHSSEARWDGMSLTFIMNCIEQNIAPDEWANAGGNSVMSIFRHDQQALLVVRTRADTHLEIQRLLRSLESLVRTRSSPSGVIEPFKISPLKHSRIRSSNPDRIR